MTSRFPLLETVLTSVAGLSLALVWCLPPSPWLAPSLLPATLVLSGAWLLGCLWRLDHTLTQWRAWRGSPAWVTTPAALASPTLALLGTGFRWEAAHVATLERALLHDGGLPEGRDARGGYPAIQAVGAADETLLRVPWTQLTTHVGLIGMTGSGKSRALECLLSQAIGADDAN